MTGDGGGRKQNQEGNYKHKLDLFGHDKHYTNSYRPVKNAVYPEYFHGIKRVTCS